MTNAPLVLTLNGGSSTLKFAVYPLGRAANRRLGGKFARLGRPDTVFQWRDESGAASSVEIGRADHRAAADFLFAWLDEKIGLRALVAVGHRIVSGGQRYRRPMRVDGEMLAELRRISAYAPEHLPTEVELIELCRERLPQIAQIACFDTTFHSDLPAVARIMPIPRRFMAKGVQRYGFHGLSYTFVMEELRREAGEAAAGGRLVLAHLGNGASLAAVKAGRSIDTSMGFTPAAGIPMSTRSGDLDPGLVLYLAQTEGMDARQFDRMVNHESGLLGISETSSDIGDLLERETTDARAEEAVTLFCYHVKKCIGAFAAALGGLDMLVFTGGIGENAAVVRERICDGLEFLGIELDRSKNAVNAPLISAGPIAVRIVATDEEAVIVRAVADVLKKRKEADR
ncbi:MAG: acetate/propionate family kinase [Devosia sp.]